MSRDLSRLFVRPPASTGTLTLLGTGLNELNLTDLLLEESPVGFAYEVSRKSESYSTYSSDRPRKKAFECDPVAIRFPLHEAKSSVS